MADWLYQASRFYQNDSGTFGRSAPYATLGLGGILELTRSIDLHVGVANLLDRSYFLVEGYPEAGRNAYVNLRLRF